MEGHYKGLKGNIKEKDIKEGGCDKNGCIMACLSISWRHNEVGMALKPRSAGLWPVC